MHANDPVRCVAIDDIRGLLIVAQLTATAVTIIAYIEA